MGHPTLSLQSIAKNISDSILSETHINEQVITEKVMLNLKIWHKLTNRPVDYDKIKTDKGRLQYTIEKKDIEIEFWRNKMKSEASEEEMQYFYRELKELVLKLGY